MRPISLIIAADLVPTQSNYDFFATGDVNSLVGSDLHNVLYAADFRVFNLEVPITDTVKPISKCGPNLIAPTATINGIKALNPTLLGLANNHILDQDEQGLVSTIELLKSYNIDSVGAGKGLNDAAKPYILEKEGLKIGVYACAEHEFTIATEKRAGANPFDPLVSLDHIAVLKAQCNYVIVLYHGGKEHYRYPSPYLQKVCRKMAEKGADIVVCQHSHCIGAKEEYAGATIVYGQGNFLFDYSESEFWKTSLLIKVDFAEKMTVEYIPICKAGVGVRLAKIEEKEKILADFELRSKQITVTDFIENEYIEFCKINGEYYLGTLAGFNRIMRGINRLTNGRLTKSIYSEKHRKALVNLIECEAHRELVLKTLKAK